MKASHLIIAALASATLLPSCRKGCTNPYATNYDPEAKKDDGMCEGDFELPESGHYEFTDEAGMSTVSYGGQTDRLDQLTELTSYIKSGTGMTLSYSAMYDMFHNTGGNGGGNFTFPSTKDLASKCFSADTSIVLGYLQMAETASQSYMNTAANGQAGVLTSGTSTYLFDANGMEPAQLVDKGLMGAVFMNQALNVYFGDDKMNVDNTTAVDAANGKYYTTMEHHFDEAFGYFGAPVDFPDNLGLERFWAKYSNSRDAVLGCNAVMMDNFILGRAAITGDNMEYRDQAIQEIRLMWEKISAYQAIAYLQQAKDYFNAGDQAKFLHALNEAYAFTRNLRYAPLETRNINSTEVDNILNTYFGTNFWNVGITEMNGAISAIQSNY